MIGLGSIPTEGKQHMLQPFSRPYGQKITPTQHAVKVTPTNPATAPPQKFLLLLFMGVNEMRVKILPLLCRLGLVLWLGSV